eukprot:6904326-Prymnesium_polylepis.1
MALEGARVVREQPKALPEVAVDLLAVRRLVEVDLFDHLADRPLAGVGVLRGQVRQPGAKGVHVPPCGEVLLPLLGHADERILNAEMLLDEVRRADGRPGGEGALQPAAERAGHRPPVRVEVLVLLVRPDRVLRMLVGRALGRVANLRLRAHEHPLDLLVGELGVVLAAVLREVPRAEQLRVPHVEVRVVGLRRVHDRHHSQRVHGAPQRGRVAVLLHDGSEGALVDHRLVVDLGGD